jgi:large subunit ribosomal protein L21
LTRRAVGVTTSVRASGILLERTVETCSSTIQGVAVYAVVRSGGKQHKVAVGDVLEVERLPGAAGETVSLPAVLLVDGESVTTDTAALAKVAVTAEVVGAVKGPKIRILKYKNKTGYRKRQGHRQGLTQLRVTGIETGQG